MSLWMVTRKNGSAWVVLAATENGYCVESGDVFCWEDSFCSLMVKGHGPNVVPDTSKTNVYRDQLIARKVQIGSYVGMPLMVDGELFGTLCAIDPAPQRHLKSLNVDLLRRFSTVISGFAEDEIRLLEAEISALKADTDSVIPLIHGLLTRKALHHFIDSLVNRADLAEPFVIMAVKVLSRGGEKQAKSVADSLKWACNQNDLACNYEHDEYVVLLRNAQYERATLFLRDLKARLNQEGIVTAAAFQTDNDYKNLMNCLLKAQSQVRESIAA